MVFLKKFKNKIVIKWKENCSEVGYLKRDLNRNLGLKVAPIRVRKMLRLEFPGDGGTCKDSDDQVSKCKRYLGRVLKRTGFK